jgi:tRNA-2-methylthio-N6-dimethylallyladenosine synthase
VTYAAPHHLVADHPGTYAVRRTSGGDAWEAQNSGRGSGVLLGMPTLGAPVTPMIMPDSPCGSAEMVS